MGNVCYMSKSAVNWQVKECQSNGKDTGEHYCPRCRKYQDSLCPIGEMLNKLGVKNVSSL